jgi:hypothetical protein
MTLLPPSSIHMEDDDHRHLSIARSPSWQWANLLHRIPLWFCEEVPQPSAHRATPHRCCRLLALRVVPTASSNSDRGKRVWGRELAMAGLPPESPSPRVTEGRGLVTLGQQAKGTKASLLFLLGHWFQSFGRLMETLCSGVEGGLSYARSVTLQ